QLSGPSTSPPPEVRFMLARLYEADGNWPNAKAQLRALVADNERNRFYLAFSIRALLRNDEGREADPWVDQLAEVAPDDWETVDFRAWRRHARGKRAAAVSSLRRCLRREDARLDLVAGLLDDLGKTADAERMYRDFVARSKAPHSSLLLARHLARHGRV